MASLGKWRYTCDRAATAEVYARAAPGYSRYEIWNGPTLSVSRTEPSALTSIICFLAFGLPGAKYVWTAKFGLIRRGPATEGIK